VALYADLPAKYAKRVSVTSNETGEQERRPQGEILQARYAEITAMDRAIGRLRAGLTTLGLRDNTLLFYCGDNGTSADAALGGPHRGVKGTLYQGGLLVPGLLEWPRRIRKPRVSAVSASTSDLLPTVCRLAKADLPQRPLDGRDISGVLDGTLTERPDPLYFWEYAAAGRGRGRPWIEPRLQEGTTPLVKKMAGKATRDFTNFHYENFDEQSFRGKQAIVDGDWKLVVSGDMTELFNLGVDRAEADNVAAAEPEAVRRLAERLRAWQEEVLRSLAGADYQH
jgi:arylsulfatase A-like enzyme